MAALPDGTLQPTPTSSQDEDEWEWEYDHNHIEHFYFTLDLTTNDPAAAEAADRVIPNNPADISDRPTSAGRSNRSTPAVTPTPRPTSADQSIEYATSLQILDLHSANPMVKLGDDLFTCQWMSELGTQFYIAREGFVTHPMWSGHVIDFVGASNARLVAKPIKLRINQSFREAAMRGDLDSAPIVIEDDEPETPQAGPNSSEVLSIPKELIHDDTTKRQAAFLERLSAVKARKKRSPVVWMKEARGYHQPSNVSEIRRKAQSQVKPETGRVQKNKAKTNGVSSKRGKGYQVKTNANFVPEDVASQGGRNMSQASSPAKILNGTHEQSQSVGGAESASMETDGTG